MTRRIAGGHFVGEERLTLNNDKQDPSNARQCLAYALFARAGVPAPRCGFAHVTAQGRDLGVYSVVEPIKKPFLARAFGSSNGALYEGQIADFNAALVGNFEVKQSAQRADRSLLQAVIAALESDDIHLWAALDAVIDMDAFLSFWAMEVLVGHWDGYGGNQNNFYLYEEPSEGRFHFIPWGTDGAFTSRRGEHPETLPKSTFVGSELTARLWSIPSIRKRYEQRLRTLMHELWDENALIAEVDRTGRLTGGRPLALGVVKQFISERHAVIEAELDGHVAPWSEVPRRHPDSCVEPQATSGRFELTWSETHRYAAGGSFEFDIPIAGEPLTLEKERYFAAGPVQEPDDPAYGTPRVALTGTSASDGRKLWIGFYVPQSAWSEGAISFHGYETFGLILELLPGGRYRRLGVIGGGTLTLEKAGNKEGAVVRGHWQATVAATPGRSHRGVNGAQNGTD